MNTGWPSCSVTRSPSSRGGELQPRHMCLLHLPGPVVDPGVPVHMQEPECIGPGGDMALNVDTPVAAATSRSVAPPHPARQSAPPVQGSASRPLRAPPGRDQPGHSIGGQRLVPPSDRARILPERVGHLALQSRAIAGTSVPDADAIIISARRGRTGLRLSRRTICCRRRPSHFSAAALAPAQPLRLCRSTSITKSAAGPSRRLSAVPVTHVASGLARRRGGPQAPRRRALQRRRPQPVRRPGGAGGT